MHLLQWNQFINWNPDQMRTFYPAFHLLVWIHYIHINTHTPVVHIPFSMLNHMMIYVYISDNYFRAHILYKTIRIMRKYYVPNCNEIFYLIWYILLYLVHIWYVLFYMSMIYMYISLHNYVNCFDLHLLMIYLIIVSWWYENLCRKYVVSKRSSRLAVKFSYNDFLSYKIPTA